MIGCQKKELSHPDPHFWGNSFDSLSGLFPNLVLTRRPVFLVLIALYLVDNVRDETSPRNWGFSDCINGGMHVATRIGLHELRTAATGLYQ
ncbi:hypothetical protein BDV41DRAFT_240892 [Aspergillus transmontanensis]|uniref:Uncharacterized protein n=1 Tax=Aspergillus transmontanensis TaxID=1034304 RepID=A0A5N6VZG4_9EURO|nr:hypothetical protein BDV41DRAFT_240892 [Aspergillus transmontanensis]